MSIEKLFKLRENQTSVRTEILAGLTTFVTMAYILAVNPNILSQTGMDQGALFTSTAVAAFVGTACMAFIANLPFALAPGMGLNAFFTYTVVMDMGASWQFALTAVFLEGLLFILLTLTRVREIIVNAIPVSIKNSISVGIGFFIAFIGLFGSGIIVQGDGVPITLGNLLEPNAIVAVLGIIITAVLVIKKVNAAILIGILASTVLGFLFGVTKLPSSIISMPPSIAPIFMKFEWNNIFSADMLIVMMTFLFVDMFDTIGTLVGVSAKANMLDKNGNIPKAREALLADALGTTAGAILGTSTVTVYVESASGVSQGGRTGLTALSAGVFFLIALIFSPIFLSIPTAATTPALVVVGLYMMAPIKNIDLEDWTEALPAFLTMIIMPFGYSIAQGIVFGIISYVALKIFSGRAKGVSPVLYVLAALFILKIIAGI